MCSDILAPSFNSSRAFSTIAVSINPLNLRLALSLVSSFAISGTISMALINCLSSDTLPVLMFNNLAVLRADQ